MPYILKKTNGEKLATIADGALYLDTDLTFVGKNYAGYGEILNQNLLKLLENFSNSSAPTQPLRGQLWYDYSQKRLKVYSGSEFKTIARLEYGGTTQPSNPAIGDLWWGNDEKLRIYNGTNFIIVTSTGNSVVTNNSGQIVDIVSSTAIDSSDLSHQILKHTINDVVIAVTSGDAFSLKSTDPLYGSEKFTVIKNGITLVGSDTITGASSSKNSYLWGTAADSLRLAGSPASDYVKSADLVGYNTSTYANITVTGTVTTSVLQSTGTYSTIRGTWVIDGTVQAQYADVAERYAADNSYQEGTVLVIGGDNEVTISTIRADQAVAGVVSKKYAHLLNSLAGTDETHPPIALAGRIPCRVVGPIQRGQSLVSSDVPGHAEAWREGDKASAIIGKALASTINNVDIIEIKV
jgi:hypothetical protein